MFMEPLTGCKTAWGKTDDFHVTSPFNLLSQGLKMKETVMALTAHLDELMNHYKRRHQRCEEDIVLGACCCCRQAQLDDAKITTLSSVKNSYQPL